MYFGELDRNGLASGFGMHTAPNGVNWRGEYLENRLNGYGVAITKPSTEWPHERRHYYQFQSNSKIAEVIYNPGMGDVFPELEEWPWLVFVGGGFTRCRGSALAPTKCGWDEPSETVVNENQIRSIVEAARVAQNKGESAAAAAGQ